LSAPARPGAALAGERGVIFDLDGLLIDSEALHHAAYSEVLAGFGVSVSRATYTAEWIAKGSGADYAVRTFDLPITPQALKAQKEVLYLAMLKERVTLMPGAREAVERMAASFPIALATNSNAESVGHVLDRLGLSARFSAVVTREQYERAKPAPDAFLAAARAIGTAPAKCLVVEDSQRGLGAAHAAGIPCVVVPNEWTRGHDFGLAVACLKSLDELTPELVRNGGRR